MIEKKPNLEMILRSQFGFDKVVHTTIHEYRRGQDYIWYLPETDEIAVRYHHALAYFQRKKKEVKER